MADEVGTLHAYLIDQSPFSTSILRAQIAAGEHAAYAGPGHALLAACGQYVRAFYPVSFDTDELKACAQCVELA